MIWTNLGTFRADLTPTAFNTWIKRSATTGSFKEKDNKNEEENELIKLRKENQRLKMENVF